MKDHSQRVLVLGLDNSGKTTILNQLLHEPIDTIQPTIGFHIKTLKLQNKTLHMWDIGGQRTLRPFWFNYFEKTDYLIWVVDVLDNRLTESLNLLKEIIIENDRINLQFETVILVNKIDLLRDHNSGFEHGPAAAADSGSTMIVTNKIDHVKKEASRVLGPEASVRVIPCSGVNGTGLDELILALTDQ